LPILLKRLRLIGEGGPSAAAPKQTWAPVLRLGQLMLCFDTNRAWWAEQAVDLTRTEFRILTLLAEKAGQDVGYREIYDLVRGKDFIAGYGTQGYRANVRTFIKRIRKKFRDVDPRFDQLENYASFGYRWTAES
jgi:two-component system response regulator ChvI